MLTLQQLKDMPDGKIFAEGIIPNSPEGIFMTRAGGNLRWLAKRGEGYHDWTIYMLFDHHNRDEVERFGDKPPSRASEIRKLVPCDDEAYAMFRS